MNTDELADIEDHTQPRVKSRNGIERARDDVADTRSRVEAVSALADKANATAQEVAQAARDGQTPGRDR